MAEKYDVFISFKNTDPKDERSPREAGQQEAQAKAGVEKDNKIDADEPKKHLAAAAKEKKAAGRGKKALLIGAVAVILVALIEIAAAMWLFIAIQKKHKAVDKGDKIEA